VDISEFEGPFALETSLHFRVLLYYTILILDKGIAGIIIKTEGGAG